MVVFLVAWLFILLFLPYPFMRIWWIAKLDTIDSFPVLLCSSNAHRKLISPPIFSWLWLSLLHLSGQVSCIYLLQCWLSGHEFFCLSLC